MAIETHFRAVGNVLITTTSGFDEGLDGAIDYNSRVLEEAIRHNCTSVLCDERNLEYRLSMFETFQLGQFVSEKIHFIRHIAIVSDGSHEEILSFWENVTNNRGVHARVFYNTDDAMNWLSLYNH